GRAAGDLSLDGDGHPPRRRAVGVLGFREARFADQPASQAASLGLGRRDRLVQLVAVIEGEGLGLAHVWSIGTFGFGLNLGTGARPMTQPTRFAFAQRWTSPAVSAPTSAPSRRTSAAPLPPSRWSA